MVFCHKVQQCNQACNAVKHFTNAYMLVYIRESKIDEILAPTKDEDTPPHLSEHPVYSLRIKDSIGRRRRIVYVRFPIN